MIHRRANGKNGAFRLWKIRISRPLRYFQNRRLRGRAPLFWRGLGVGVGKLVATGYLVSCWGAALLLYGYFAPHVSSLIDWYRNIPVWMVNYLPPAWMADCLPNLTQVDAARVGRRRAFPLAVAVKVLISCRPRTRNSLPGGTSHERLSALTCLLASWTPSLAGTMMRLISRYGHRHGRGKLVAEPWP
jgi:hypothetical protein